MVHRAGVIWLCIGSATYRRTPMVVRGLWSVLAKACRHCNDLFIYMKGVEGKLVAPAWRVNSWTVGDDPVGNFL